MTSVEIIEEIKRLPRAERDQVFDFVRKSGETRALTPNELGELAREMAATKDPAEADRLQAAIVRGFYGAGRPMPKIRREKLPERLLAHLLLRVRQRSISHENIILLARWLDTEPEVPVGRWFKIFPEFTVCGEGELIKTFLVAGQVPDGCEI